MAWHLLISALVSICVFCNYFCFNLSFFRFIKKAGRFDAAGAAISPAFYPFNAKHVLFIFYMRLS